jgi:hypothetical protein
MRGSDAAHTASPTDVIEKYETLRTAVRDEGLNLESRNGLALFLRRGMWGWVQAATTPITPLPSTRSTVASSVPDEGDDHRAVIHLFAEMAMRSAKRRAHERIS